MIGGDGDDTFNDYGIYTPPLGSPAGNPDTMDGGPGMDTVSYYPSGDYIVANLGTGVVQTKASARTR